MQDDLCEIAVVLDRSGSMEQTKADAEGGFNQFIADQRKEQGRCNVSLMQFDTVFETVYQGKPIAEVPKLDLRPRGSTALLDAIGKTINTLGTCLAKTAERDRPGKVIVLIVTDGQENSSREFTYPKIDEMIRHQRDKYNWSFIFIGANQDAIATAVRMGIDASYALTSADNAVGSRRAYDSSSKLVALLRAKKVQKGFTDEDRDAQREAGAKS